MKNNSKKMLLVGGDPLGHVFDMGSYILRTESEEYPGTAKKAFMNYEKYNLSQFGIVETRALSDDIHFLQHKKYRITYPHEWTPSMFKDAVLFHLQLLADLDQYGLTLKDALPENIVFDGCKPVFVDFYSIIETEALSKEQWLASLPQEDLRVTVLRTMFFPYMLLPLLCHAENAHKEARLLLANLFCNNRFGRTPQWEDIPVRKKYHNLRMAIVKLIGGFPGMPWKRRIAELIRLVEEMSVTPPQGAYFSYYEEKKEVFPLSPHPDWQDKQRSVFHCLKSIHPQSVLDIGANTGWFSQLAVNAGAHVIALANDESCIDSVYRSSKDKNLPVTPLFLPFSSMTEQHFAKTADTTNSPLPFHRAALDRLNCEMVLCLGLFHHLILGKGLHPHEVLAVLAKLTDKALVLEFVDLDDPKITGEPQFFEHLNAFSREHYNLDHILELCRCHFSQVEILPSEKTRHILFLQH